LAASFARSGRYLKGAIKTTAEAAAMLASGKPYIIDETTAAVRFIIKVETTKRNIIGNFDEAECNERL
jgi:hypothetical protein